MKKYELLEFLEPFNDEIDIWVHVPGKVSELAAECKYVPATGEGYAFIRIVAGSPPAHGDKP